MSTPLTVIIAEDPMIRHVLRTEFSHRQFAVLLASDAAEAEAFASRTVASLVLLQLPSDALATYEACARIRRRDGYRTQPIVLTANTITGRVQAAAERAGATLVLAKPYSIATLLNALEAFVPAEDPLLADVDARPGMAAPAIDWKGVPLPSMGTSGDSALSRNGLLLPIVRGNGVLIPMIREGMIARAASKAPAPGTDRASDQPPKPRT